MAQVWLVVWNVEHMNRLFVSDAKEAALKPRTDETDDVFVGERLDDITAVLAALDPDCLVVVEGPSRPEEFALFFENMEGQWVTHLQLTRRPNYSSQQNIGIAVRTDRGLFAADAVHGFDSAQEAAFEDFAADVDLDRVPERYHYERLPLHAEVRMADGGRFRVLGVHLKSKALGDAVEWGRWWALAEGNRRRILAQARNLHAKFIRP